MIRQSSPLRRSPIRPWNLRQRKGVPGGEYIFDLFGTHYELPGRFVQDDKSQSDDGLRWIATRDSNKVINSLVCRLADKQCQMRTTSQCWRWTPIDLGHPHHVIHKKMGGAFTDDRIFLTIDGESKQIRIWACPKCHQHHHNRLYFTPKEEAA